MSNKGNKKNIKFEKIEPIIDAIVDDIDTTTEKADAQVKNEVLREVVRKEENVKFEDVKEEITPDFIDEMGVIAAKTKLEGNIVTKGHITILGTVIGDVIADGNVIVGGTVKGKIKGNNVLFDETCADIEVEIEAKGQVAIEKGVIVKGNIDCEDVKVKGSIIGNVIAKSKAGFAETAALKGNITSRGLAVAIGAKIEGSVAVK